MNRFYNDAAAGASIDCAAHPRNADSSPMRSLDRHAIRRTIRRSARVLPRRVFVWFLVLAMLVPAMAGGAPFVWCEGMRRAQLECCCHGADDAAFEKSEPKRDGQDAIETSCCVGRRVATAATNTGATAPDATIAPAAVVGWLTLDALLATVDVPGEARVRRREHAARAGPEPPTYALVCSYLI